jgi:hypothetical protein
MTELWRKESHSFLVEIKVGESWVQHAAHELESDARSDADIMSRDFSVNAVRILTHALTHRCSILDEMDAVNTLALPPKMTPTGKRADCPRCHKPAPVGTDTANEWIFCPHCDSAFPA